MNTNHKKLSLLFLLISAISLNAIDYGKANTRNPKTAIPSCTKPAFDHWMRDTWETLGPDGYYYMTGTTSTPGRHFPGQTHCWDWNDGLYLWRSKDLKTWGSKGLIWSLDKDATWQKGPRVYKADEKYSKKIA